VCTVSGNKLPGWYDINMIPVLPGPPELPPPPPPPSPSPLLTELKERIRQDIASNTSPHQLYPYERRWNFDIAPLALFPNKTTDDVLLCYLRWAEHKITTSTADLPEKNTIIVDKAFQRLQAYGIFAEKNRGILLRPPITIGNVRRCYARLGLHSMKQVDSEGRRVLCLDLSYHKKYDERHKNDQDFQLQANDYLRLIWYIIHACIFDDVAIVRGVAVVVNLNYIGPFAFRSAFPSSARANIREATNGISCFKMKVCHLLHEPWWMKGLLVMMNPFVGSDKLKHRIKRQGKKLEEVAVSLGSVVQSEEEKVQEVEETSNEKDKDKEKEKEKDKGEKPVNKEGTNTCNNNSCISPDWTLRYPAGFCGVGTNVAGDHWMCVGAAAVNTLSSMQSLANLRNGTHLRHKSEQQEKEKKKMEIEKKRRATYMTGEQGSLKMLLNLRDGEEKQVLEEEEEEEEEEEQEEVKIEDKVKDKVKDKVEVEN
jgi:hypothetical protein